MEETRKRERPEKTHHTLVTSATFPTCDPTGTQARSTLTSTVTTKPPRSLIIATRGYTLHYGNNNYASVHEVKSALDEHIRLTFDVAFALCRSSCQKLRGLSFNYTRDLERSPPTKANRVRFRIFASGELSWTTPLVSRFSRRSSVSPALASRRCSILASLHPHRFSRPRCQVLSKPLHSTLFPITPLFLTHVQDVLHSAEVEEFELGLRQVLVAHLECVVVHLSEFVAHRLASSAASDASASLVRAVLDLSSDLSRSSSISCTFLLSAAISLSACKQDQTSTLPPSTHSRSTGCTRQQNGGTGWRRVVTPFANERLVNYSPAGGQAQSPAQPVEETQRNKDLKETGALNRRLETSAKLIISDTPPCRLGGSRLSPALRSSAARGTRRRLSVGRVATVPHTGDFKVAYLQALTTCRATAVRLSVMQLVAQTAFTPTCRSDFKDMFTTKCRWLPLEEQDPRLRSEHGCCSGQVGKEAVFFTMWRWHGGDAGDVVPRKTPGPETGDSAGRGARLASRHRNPWQRRLTSLPSHAFASRQPCARHSWSTLHSTVFNSNFCIQPPPLADICAAMPKVTWATGLVKSVHDQMLSRAFKRSHFTVNSLYRVDPHLARRSAGTCATDSASERNTCGMRFTHVTWIATYSSLLFVGAASWVRMDRPSTSHKYSAGLISGERVPIASVMLPCDTDRKADVASGRTRYVYHADFFSTLQRIQEPYRTQRRHEKLAVPSDLDTDQGIPRFPALRQVAVLQQYQGREHLN
ncbi:hypothetical protein PR048_015854 [Dryococelus australis]|uniref:Uncharacterized protein n=1 Tax=Dryococelus australis TaxID=614101 RepID=A0ABQ9HI53_9NEOP|nr:hypothetical protein PR048_015854 [Dryococelus australis]